MKVLGLLLTTLLMTQTAFANNGNGQLNGYDGRSELGVPVLVNPQNPDKTYGGVVSVQPTAQNPNALNILRNELARQEAVAQQKAAREGVFWNTTKRFTPESMTFFVAIGLVTFNSMWIKSHGDPLAMERHIMSLKDPIAHLSFYAFMQTQGFYTNFHTRGAKFAAMDASTRAQMMRRLSYQGMALGSLASSIVADLGRSVTMCVDKWLKGKRDNQSLASCNMAWQGWTARSKFTQYFPQIISMWVSQAATEFVENAARRGFEKVAATSWVRRIASKEFLVRAAYKITAADVVTTFVGGGWVTKSIKVVGRVTRFTGFVAVDHLLAGYTYPIVNSIIQPALFEMDAINLDRQWHAADRGQWNLPQTRRAPYRFCGKSFGDYECRTVVPVDQIAEFERAVTNYGERMQQWRDHLNSDADQDLAGWMELTKKLLNQVESAYAFYRSFVGHMNTTVNTHYLVKNRRLDPNAWTILDKYPFRPLPLYGVSIGRCRLIGSTNMADHLLIDPNNVEQCQKEVVQAAGRNPRFRNAVNSLRRRPREAAAYNQIIRQLSSHDVNVMGRGIHEINTVLGLHAQQRMQAEGGGFSQYSSAYIDALYNLKRALGGNPEPKLYRFEGFAEIMAKNSNNYELKEAADFGLFSLRGGQRYRFTSETDMFVYKMICGGASASLNKTQLFGVAMLSPQFEPPALVNIKRDRASFCGAGHLGSMIYKNPVGGKELYQYLADNMNTRAFGNLTGNTPPDGRVFDWWWQTNAKIPLNPEFRSYDQKYRVIHGKAMRNFNGKPGWFTWAISGLNQSMYLPKDVQKSLKAEANVYLQILNRTLLSGQVRSPDQIGTRMPNAPTTTSSRLWAGVRRYTGPLLTSLSNLFKDATLQFDYAEFATKASLQNDFNPVYKRRVREIVALHNLMNGYHGFVTNNNRSAADFNAYIAHAKLVDTAINDILVIAGYKTVQQGASMSDSFDFSAPAETGTENSQKVYTDRVVQNPTYKQRMAIAAIQGLRRVENEMKRYIRMKYSLKNTLEFDNREFMAEWNKINPPARNGQTFNPFGR